MPPEFKVYKMTHGLCIAESKGVLIGLVRELMTQRVMREIGYALDEAARRYPDNLTTLTVYRLPTGADLKPTEVDQARTNSRELLKSLEGRVLGSASVMSINGFLGAMLRGAITSVVLIVQPKVPVRVFGSARDALEWLLGLQRRADPRLGAAELDHLVTHLMAEQDAAPYTDSQGVRGTRPIP